MVVDSAGWLSVKRSMNSMGDIPPSTSSIPESAQRRCPTPGSWLSGPTAQFLSSAGAPRAAPPRISVPAPAAAAAVMRSSCSRCTAE